MEASNRSVAALTKFIYAVISILIIASVLVFSELQILSHASGEVGDFAANSLLIQDAKHFGLWVGNYSRVGFNHPGPAFLYLLAAGEGLLFDYLHWAPSAFAGQLVAVALFNSFWMVMMCYSILKDTKSLYITIIAFLTFALISAFSESQVFTGIWFPHLYYFPFAGFLFFAHRLILGKADSSIPLALSTGFLINGHVSFIFTLGVTAILLLVLHHIFYRTLNLEKESVLSKKWLVQNKDYLCFSILILAVFLLPLGIMTITHFPGPLHEYLTFGKDNKANSLKSAIAYVSVYWGGRKSILLATIFMIFTVFFVRKHSAQREYLFGLVAVVLATTIAAILYAKIGIDMLDQIYIENFYYAVPAYFGAGLIIILMKEIKSINPLLAFCISVVLFSATYSQIKKPVSYAVLFDQNQQNKALYDALVALKADNSRMVLELDNTKDWGVVWSRILGVALYAKRSENKLFCVHQNWHVSFTRDLRCTDTEVRENNRFAIISTQGASNLDKIRPLISASDLNIYASSQRAPLESMEYQSVASNKHFFMTTLNRGWSALDAEMVWTLGSSAEIGLRLQPDSLHRLTVDVGAFLPDSTFKQTAEFYVNNIPAGTFEFTSDSSRQQIVIELPPIKSDLNLIEIKVRKPISPSAYGLSADSRLLGISLFGLKVEKE